MRVTSLTVSVLFIALVNCGLSSPVKEARQMASFLWKFGYIDEDDIDNNRGAYDPNSPAFQASIRRLQWFGNINVTGRIDAATISLINTERCGVKDPVNSTAVGRFTLQGTTWKKRDLTYRILKFRKDRNLPEEVQRRIFRKAFDLWQSASGLRIREKYWGNSDILISFVSGRHEDSYPLDGKGGTLAHAFYPLSNKGLSGDAHFDNDEEFTTGTPNGINLDWVAIHEFGHSLGLEHSNVHESIMYPWYKGYHRDIKLTKDDILGIQALYPKPTDRLTSPEVRTTPKSTTTRRPRVTPRSTRRPHVTPRRPLPSLCGSSIRYDTVFMGPTGWTYFFVGDKYWQLDRKLRRYGPRMINGYWSELKTPVDAAYLNRRRNVVFFKGSEFWEYSSTGKLIKSGNISSYGLPLTLANMDAVFIWEGNNKTYFFKGSKYWKYDDETRRLQRYYYVRYRRYSYPRDIRAVWRFYENVKAAVKWSNGRNYVFWDKQYLKLQKGSVRREVGYPQIISDRWMRCNVKGRDLGPVHEP